MANIRFTSDLTEKVKAMLGGKNPTVRRMTELLDELADRRRPEIIQKSPEGFTVNFRTPPRMETPMAFEPDESDIEHQRVPHHGTPVDPEIARQRLAERMEANRNMGLDPNAPPIVDEVPAAPPAEFETPQTPPHHEPPVDTPELRDEVDEIERRKAAGFSKIRQVADSLERQTLQRMPSLRAAGRSLKTLDEAADVLLAELQPSDQDAIRQVSTEDNMDVWVVMLGAVARMAALKELNNGEFAHEWLNRGSAKGTPISMKEERCKMCDGVIPPDPVKRGRSACCNRHGSGQVEHTEGCPLADLQMVRGQWRKVAVGA